MRLFDNNLGFGTAATVAVSSAETTLPGTNLLNANRRKIWQTASGTMTATAVIDLGAAYDITGFALVSSNLGTAGTVTIQAHTSDSWGSPAFSNGAQAVYAHSYTEVLLWYWTSKTYRYWRVILDDPGNPDNCLKVGVAWLGTYVSPESNFRYGWHEEIIPLSRTSYADDGTPYTDELGSYKLLSLDIPFLSESWARNTLMPLLKRVAAKKDVVLALFPERTAAEGTAVEHGANYYGRIMVARSINTSFQRYDWPEVRFRES